MPSHFSICSSRPIVRSSVDATPFFILFLFLSCHLFTTMLVCLYYLHSITNSLPRRPDIKPYYTNNIIGVIHRS
ncbi:hypothetical protein M426DRAFT_158203 [Hypoxylon sp. CI-4A]|nr:hypothetical protein M426DRAFT_158203 [Hypoxylon sp. CI-4A]